MKNTNSPFNKIKTLLGARWSSADYPGAEPRFQLTLFAKDILIFVFVPLFTVVLFKACENATGTTGKAKRPRRSEQAAVTDSSRSQIINFVQSVSQTRYAGVAKRSPGSLVKVRLLNMVETYSNVPVHAQIVDAGLGRPLMGGTLIGDAIADTSFDRVNINFRFVRDPRNNSVAIPVSARALGLDGTLGLIARKKEGFFARSAIGSANTTAQDLQGKGGGSDFKDVLFKALTAGLIQEFGSSSKVERNRAQVLTLRPHVEFYAELTDFFPGDSK